MLARKLLQRCQSLTRGAAGFVYQPQTADPNLGKNHLHLCFDKFILWFFLAETVDRQARIMGLFSLKSKHLIPYQIVFLLKLFLILTVVLNRWDDKAQYVPVYQQCDGYSHGGRLQYRFVVIKVVCLSACFQNFWTDWTWHAWHNFFLTLVLKLVWIISVIYNINIYRTK